MMVTGRLREDHFEIEGVAGLMEQRLNGLFCSRDVSPELPAESGRRIEKVRPRRGRKVGQWLRRARVNNIGDRRRRDLTNRTRVEMGNKRRIDDATLPATRSFR